MSRIKLPQIGAPRTARAAGVIGGQDSPGFVHRIKTKFMPGGMQAVPVSSFPYLFLLGTSGANAVISVFDVASPAVPVYVGTVSLGLGPLTVMYNVMMDSQHIYALIGLGDGPHRVIIDVTTPASPTIVFHEGPPAPIYGGMLVRTGVSYANNVMFTGAIATANKTMRSVNISNPASPALINEVTIPSGAYNSGGFGYDATHNRIYFLHNPATLNADNYGYFNVASDGMISWGGFTTIYSGLSPAAYGIIAKGLWWYNSLRADYFYGFPLEPQSGTPSKSFVAYGDNGFHLNGILNPVVWDDRWFVHATHYTNANAYPLEFVDLNDATNPITTRRHIGTLGSTCNWFTIIGNFIYWLKGLDNHLMVTDLTDMDNLQTVNEITLSTLTPLSISASEVKMWTGNNGMCAT